MQPRRMRPMYAAILRDAAQSAALRDDGYEWAGPELDMTTSRTRALSCSASHRLRCGRRGFPLADPVPFNWALDWFDAELARESDSKDRPALWIVDAGSNRETKLSFEALSRRSNQVANFLRAQGLQARRSSAAAARQCRSAVGDHAGGDEARRGGDPRHHAADAGRVARPARSWPRQSRWWRSQDQVAKFAGLGGERSHSHRRRCSRRSKRAGWPYEQAAEFPGNALRRTDRPTSNT